MGLFFFYLTFFLTNLTACTKRNYPNHGVAHMGKQKHFFRGGFRARVGGNNLFSWLFFWILKSNVRRAKPPIRRARAPRFQGSRETRQVDDSGSSSALPSGPLTTNFKSVILVVQRIQFLTSSFFL